MIRFPLRSLFLVMTLAVVAMSVIYRWWPFDEVREAVLNLVQVDYLLVAFIAAFICREYRIYRYGR